MFYNIKALSLQVFFMVLDLRLRRLPVVMTSNFFLCLPESAADVGSRNGGGGKIAAKLTVFRSKTLTLCRKIETAPVSYI